jgi:hypothetical protein
MATIERAPREGLVPHLLVTLKLDWARPPADVARALEDVQALEWVETGAHEDYVARIDAPAHGDPARDARYRAALAQVRALADERATVDLDLLARVQGLVLDDAGEEPRPAPLRTTTAFAPNRRGGLTAYAWFDGLEAMLRRKVQVDAADGLHPVVQACRLYLDLIFFHPFADGNARAARLWFEFLLRRGRVRVPPLVDVVRLEKIPGDPDLPWRFVRAALRGYERGL